MHILILGHGRHGKDTFAELLCEKTGLNFASSSEFCAQNIVFPKFNHLEYVNEFGGRVYFTNWQDCFNYRQYYRPRWRKIIADYNKHDPTRLACEIGKNNQVYVGMRSEREFLACLVDGIFDLIIWVDASGRKPNDETMTIDYDDTMMYRVDNNGDIDNLRAEVDVICMKIFQNTPKPTLNETI